MGASSEITSEIIALGARLKNSRAVTTLGLYPNFSDYSARQAEMIRHAEKIYFPTLFYADLFNAMGKKTFPSFHTYKFAQDKIKQTAMFTLLNIPHPKTRIFYGKRQKSTIFDHFDFPFIAKIPRGSSMGKGITLIQNNAQLSKYLDRPGPAYIQEYLPVKKDMRIIIIGKEPVHYYWRIAPDNDFRTNVSQGGEISFAPLPRQAIDLALDTALTCGWDDVGIDVIEYKGKFYVLEANMKYGTKGFKQAGIDYKELMESLILKGKI
ncbi:MAG: RimK family alpha-L-glutamate ligase [Desulfobacteraceae bacterium]